MQKILIRGILFFFLLCNGHGAEIDKACSYHFKQLIKKAKNTLPSLARDMAEAIKDPYNVSVDQIYRAFVRLKEEEEIFFDTYVNRSPNKRKLTEGEVDVLRENFNVLHLEAKDVQYFYGNEIQRLYFFLEQALLELDALDLTKRVIQKTNSSPDTTYSALLRTYHALRSSGRSTDSIGIRASDIFSERILLSEEVGIALGEFYRAFLAGEEFDLHKSLQDIGLGHHYYKIEKAFKEDKVANEVCCLTGTGCLFCPNNLGLRYKNIENRDKGN